MPLPKAVPVSRIYLRDEAYVRVRDWILDGTLAPGEPLRDETLAIALGMSRTPVREALQRLEEDGLVMTTAKRRTSVSPVSLQQAREIFPMVAALEDFALQCAEPKLDDSALRAMDEANVQMAEALEAKDADEAMAADIAFHGVIIERSGNSELTRVLGDLKFKVRRIDRAFFGSADRSASVVDHQELIDALRRRDRSGARRVLRRNWERALHWINPEP
jgi:DNA-binding GntR family transcriptional regulator